MNIQILLLCEKALSKHLYMIYVSCISGLFQTLPNIYAKIDIGQNSKCTSVYGKGRTFLKLKNGKLFNSKEGIKLLVQD